MWAVVVEVPYDRSVQPCVGETGNDFGYGSRCLIIVDRHPDEFAPSPG